MEMEHQQRKETEEKDENGNPKVEYETTKSVDTLNSMVPIWKRNKKDVTDEEYKSFYKEKFYDYAEPLRVIHQKAEGTTEYQALLYIPSHAEFNYYSKDFERGLQLYSSGVMIMERCADLLPEYFGFVKGLVDSEDLSLNISREMLQHDRQLTLIRTALEKRIKHELSDMLEKSREDYEKFWNTFGLTIKFGIYQSYGANRGQLEDLLLLPPRLGRESSSPSRSMPTRCRRDRNIATMPRARALKSFPSCRRPSFCGTRAMICSA